MLVDWEPETSVGVDALDAHHRQVWRRVRHLASAVADGSAEEIRGSLRLLHGYLAEHDAAEESAMEDAGYPGAREHARAHAAVRERIAAAREGSGDGELPRLLEAAEWVARALASHARGDDLKLGRFLTARENLRRLAEAEPGAAVCLTPVPGSLPAVSPGPAAVSGGDAARPAGPAEGPSPARP